MQPRSGVLIAAVLAAATAFISATTHADALNCSLMDYKASPGMVAAVEGNTLVVTWNGDRNEEVRLRLTINAGTPTVQDVAIKKNAGSWVTLASNMTPEFRVVSGLRRMTNQQLQPLKDAGVQITQEILAEDKWEAFWDAPLNISGTQVGQSFAGSLPPTEGILDQPGLPRKPDEIHRAAPIYQAQSCAVKTNGARLEVSFPGVELGVFSGRLQYTVYKGTNLIRQEVIARTEDTSVAYKYDAGLKGLAIQPKSRMIWRDTGNNWQDYRFGGTVNDGPVTLVAGNRLVAAEGQGGSIAAFPPPHNFFWSREIDTNLGYDWYRKESATSFSFGVRQAESESSSEYAQNFALRSARPGTWQRMPVYLYVSDESGRAALESAIAYTRQDRFKVLAGYDVMATHFHASLVRRLQQTGSLNFMLPDFEVVKATGINIYAPIDGGGSGANAAEHVRNLALYYEAARLHSDKDFVVMPNEEIGFNEFSAKIGGHNDLLVSHPVYWSEGRDVGQPFVEDDPKYGKVYHVGGRDDLIEMAHRENLLIYMPHPRSKGSTGYPDVLKDTAFFRDEDYRGFGFRWGMGLDGSEQRLCDYRCQPLFDDMNNWVADLPTPPKYIQAISEVYAQEPGDDVYANNPVNYVKLDALPGPDNWKPIVDAMKHGDYFVTSGEVLIPSYQVQGTGNRRTIVADVEWTFPPEFAEVVWGDGQKTDRQIISMTDMQAFGKHHFEIPFDVSGKKWVRFAVWDSAGNGAMVQPIKIAGAATAASVGH